MKKGFQKTGFVVIVFIALLLIFFWQAEKAEGTPYMVKDINLGENSSIREGLEVGVSTLTNVDGTLFFAADDGIHGVELWKSDGTAAGTMMVKDINQKEDCGYGDQMPCGSNPYGLTNVNGTLFFAANDGVYCTSLWKSDGTETGTVELDAWCDPIEMVNVNGTLFFTLADGSLWKSNGANYPGTDIVTDHPWVTFTNSLVNVNGTLFFVAGYPTLRLWKSDGTEEGTVIVKELNIFIGPDRLVNVNGTLFFVADDGVHGFELWKSNGTEAGTVMVKDINPLEYSSLPDNLVNVNGTLFFTADDGLHGHELWKSDGTTTGTHMVKNICPEHSGPDMLTNVNDTLFFTADDGIHGNELWKSDGTYAGTVMVKDINAGEESTGFYDLMDMNGRLFFVAYEGVHGWEIWRSNGTEDGTFMVKDIYPGNQVSDPFEWPGPFDLVNVNGKLFFAADDGVHGHELWVDLNPNSYPLKWPSVIGQLHSVYNGLDSTYNRLYDALHPRVPPVPPAPEGIIGRLEAMANHLHVLNGRIFAAMGRAPVTPMPSDAEMALMNIREGAMGVAGIARIGFVPPYDGEGVHNALMHVLNSAKMIIENVNAFMPSTLPSLQ